MRKWENSRTGELVNVPVGIDPGWDFNAGEVAHSQYAARFFVEKIKAASADVGCIAMQSSGDYIRDALLDDFQRWVQTLIQQCHDGAEGSRTVAVLRANVISALWREGLILESAAVVLKGSKVVELYSEAEGFPIPANDLVQLPKYMENPKFVVLDPGHNTVNFVIELENAQLVEVIVELGLITDLPRVIGGLITLRRFPWPMNVTWTPRNSGISNSRHWFL